MIEFTMPEREALAASANTHEQAAKTVMEVSTALIDSGYTVYAKKLREVVVQMISHVDTAREIARRET